MGNSYSIKRECKAGFSLIELMIVIAIMGVLAVVVIPAMTSYLNQAKVGTTETNIKTIKKEVDRYIRKVQKAPRSLKDLVRKPAEMSKREWGGPYIEGGEVPEDGWGASFVYKQTEGHPPYKLYSWGEDGPGSAKAEWIYP
jgi:general secretion pathway protein G